MKTLKAFESNKIDFKDVFGGKGGNGPTMSVVWVIHGPVSITSSIENLGSDIQNHPNAVPEFTFDQGAQ